MSINMFSQSLKKAELVSINGKNIYYEIYGEGKPLFLLHGYTQSSISWKSYVKDYEQEYEVYLVDLSGHGKSDPFREDLVIKSVAEDLNALIKYLKLEHIKAIGFSFGGDVLYQLALINPTLIESMISIGAIGTWTIQDFPEYLEVFTFENRTNFPWLAASHDSDEHIKAILHQFKNYTVQLSNEELQSIQPEVLIMIGDDDDGMSLKEIFRARENLPNSDLWILPDIAHGAHENENKEEFIKRSKLFLSK
ncbi:MAG: alpha/beta hydrolase [Chitinophagales bacterium]|nr:alpha/beta hydrolase [Chitinophagales bacterium]